MVNDTSTITPGAAQQLAPTDPLATAIQAHKLALAAYLEVVPVV